MFTFEAYRISYDFFFLKIETIFIFTKKLKNRSNPRKRMRENSAHIFWMEKTRFIPSFFSSVSRQ